MEQTTLKYIKNFPAIDITNEKISDLEKIRKNKIETLYLSCGKYGMNGCVIADQDGNLYKITARNSALFYMV